MLRLPTTTMGPVPKSHRISARGRRRSNKRWSFPKGLWYHWYVKIASMFGLSFFILYLWTIILNAFNREVVSTVDVIYESAIPKTIYIVHKYDLCDVTKPSHFQHLNWEDDEFYFKLMINVQKIKALHPDYNVVCYDDDSAYDYILNVKQDPIFADYFRNEHTGTYKSDLFRIFLLFHEGGYYFDSDMEPRMSLNEVTSSMSGPITFISAIAQDRMSVFQSILGATKGNPILKQNLDIFRDYYSKKKRLPNNMGCVFLGNVLQSISGKPLDEMAGEMQFGEQRTRLLEERKYEGVDADEILEQRKPGKSWDYIFELAVYDIVTGKYPFWSRFTGYGNAYFRKLK